MGAKLLIKHRRTRHRTCSSFLSPREDVAFAGEAERGAKWVVEENLAILGLRANVVWNLCVQTVAAADLQTMDSVRRSETQVEAGERANSEDAVIALQEGKVATSGGHLRVALTLMVPVAGVNSRESANQMREEANPVKGRLSSHCDLVGSSKMVDDVDHSA